MKLGTSTNLLFIRPDGTRATLGETLEKVSQAGFKVFDLNFYDWSLPGSIFLTDDWEKWIYSTAEKAERLGVTFGQCHGYFYNFLDPRLIEEERKYHEMLQKRSFACCHILKAHTCVLHPETDYSSVEISKKSYVANREYFNKILEQMQCYSMRIAVENMCDYGIAPKRKFGTYPEELLEFVKSFKDSRVGICWDFEHADIMQQNQEEALKHIGTHLYATHVSDTHSKLDNRLMHVLPLSGGIDWKIIMKTLREINYKGDFCYEVHNYANCLPDVVIPTALKLAYEIGEYLMSL